MKLRKQQITIQISPKVLEKARDFAGSNELAMQVGVERLIQYGLVYIKEQDNKLKES